METVLDTFPTLLERPKVTEPVAVLRKDNDVDAEKVMRALMVRVSDQ